ncbi:hypothetical protein T8K17_07915 [Thalassobaculum sp. OXR-137]|nr:hypothetical protein [Thalassobaculum sp. OXR-137]WPZ36059.1 hypothetical protein T8K17_07915 [Thalassobaculum sp. OXR-137]
MNQPFGLVRWRPAGLAASLFATFAIAPSAGAAEKLSVGIGGEYTQYFG